MSKEKKRAMETPEKIDKMSNVAKLQHVKLPKPLTKEETEKPTKTTENKPKKKRGVKKGSSRGRYKYNANGERIIDMVVYRRRITTLTNKYFKISTIKDPAVRRATCQDYARLELYYEDMMLRYMERKLMSDEIRALTGISKQLSAKRQELGVVSYVDSDEDDL